MSIGVLMMNITFSENSISVPFNELISFVIGGDWGKDPSYINPEYSLAYCIRGSEFRNWDNDKGKTASLRKIKNSKIESRKLEECDILVEISGGGPEQPVGRTVLIDRSVLSFEKDVPKICTNFLRLVRTHSIVNSKYLNFYLNLFYASGEVTKYQAGSNNLRNLKFADYSQIKIPLIPLPEQRAIVSKIEQLFSELDNGISNLKLAQEQLKVYRQAVLKKAFEGELTKEWREQQADLPNADELLDEIKREKEKAAKVSGRKKRTSKPLDDIELTKLSTLPNGWLWTQLGEMIEHIQAGKSIKCDERPPKPNELGIVKVSSVSWGEFNPKESKTCFDDSSFNEDYIIHEGDFLISRANTIELVGACVVVKSKSENLMLSDKILRLEFTELFNKYYSLYYLRSAVGRKEIESLATGNQESMRNIGQDRIKRIAIPLCSLQEQQAIVQEIETRLSVCDKLEQDIADNLEKAEALRQSILKKAFEGRLLNERELEEVRNAPDWEPAEVLLERVKAEKKGKK